jgi:hypothetical protein
MIQSAQAPAVVAARARGSKSPPPSNDSPTTNRPAEVLKRPNRTAEDQFLDAVRERIHELGLKLDELDVRAGLADRYAQKILTPRASGRTAKWCTWEAVLGALFPNGFKISVTELPPPDQPGRP